MMRIKNLFILLSIFCFLSGSFAQRPCVFIYHFYANERCPGDLRIEYLTKHTLDSLFKNEMTKKIIIMKSVNFEKHKNEKLAKKFNISTIALVFNIIDSKGKETAIDLTDWAFANVWDEGKFRKELQQKISEALEIYK